MRPHDPNQEAYWRSRLKEPPYVLDHEARLLVLGAAFEVCRHRNWTPYGIHVRTTHVHAVISGEVKPERMLSDFKAYATRALRSPATNRERSRYWTTHGSTRYLWNETSLKAAVEYVLNGQGTRMACYPE